jgi:hypothetical protein
MGNIGTTLFYALWIAPPVALLILGGYLLNHARKTDKPNYGFGGAALAVMALWVAVCGYIYYDLNVTWELRDLASDDQKYFRANKKDTPATTFITIPSDIAYEAAGALKDDDERKKAIEQIKAKTTTGAEYIKFLSALNTAYGDAGTISSTPAPAGMYY